MATVEFNYQNLQVKLDRIIANIPDALRAAGLSLLTAAARNITEGGPFAPWSASYAKRTKPHQQLWLTATLLRSLTMNGPNNVFEQSGNTLTIGSNVIYAKYLNFGFPPNNNPARPFLFIDSQRADAAKAAFMAQLLKGIK